MSLVFIYMTAYQMLHRAAKANSGERGWCTARPAGWAPRFSNSRRPPGYASTARRRVMIAPPSSGWISNAERAFALML
ncbi:MAG: hypothetical protein ACM4D3_18510 [Candidatus Sericytochromatia bacterium]